MTELSQLMADAARLRDRGHGRLISYSRKVFIPLTHLCRDVCHYCTFAERPRAGQPAYLSPDQVLAIARAGQAAGCTEALFTLGDKPELRYAAAREALAALGYKTTIEYLTAMCGLVLRETGLLPHANPGVMTREEIAALRAVTASQGIMLESTSERLVREGRRALRLARQASGGAAGDDPPGRRAESAVHHRHPDRHRRDARGAHRNARGDPRPARSARPYPGGHRPELPRQARHQARRCRRARPRRPSVDHRPGAADPRAGHEHPGAAQPLARRLSAPDRRRPERLGRHLAGDARSCESRGAVACDRRAGASQCRDGQAAGQSAGDLSRLCPRARYLARARGRHASAAHERRRGLCARRRLGARQHRAAAGAAGAGARGRSARSPASSIARPPASASTIPRSCACSRRAMPTTATSPAPPMR